MTCPGRPLPPPREFLQEITLLKGSIFCKDKALCLRKYFQCARNQNQYNLQEMSKQLNFTTVQSQFFMEGVELILDLHRTGAVFPCAEIQQDVDLQEKDTQNSEVRTV